MCGLGSDTGIVGSHVGQNANTLGLVTTSSQDEMVALARHLCTLPENRSAHLGMIGYGKTKEGDRVLIAVDGHYDPDVVRVVATALRERGARVDILTLDVGPDRPFTFQDEIDAIMRRRSWREEPRRWEGIPWVEDLAAREGYDLLIHGKGGPVPPTTFRYEQFPWMSKEHFTPDVVLYPSEIIAAIAQKTWDIIWQHGRGGRVRLTDREGTDLSYTLDETYWDGTHHGWVPEPRRWYGHLFAHPTPPLPYADAEGIACGTTSHFSRAFSQIRVTVEGGQVTHIEGGDAYGDAWRAMLEETRHTQYPCFPRPGLFYLWEAAIGGHPKIARPRNIEYLSSGGFEWERRRTGVIHLGFGTFWRGKEEEWAAERGLLFGHLHIHLLFPTYELVTRSGERFTLIRDGRMTAMDDPEVRKLAEKYGDPDELLKEAWIPAVPGITAPGSYQEYAADPGRWIYSR